MWIILVVGLALASASHHDGILYSGRNQRIIKLHSSPYKHHPHHKHVRPGPLGPHHHYHEYDQDTHYEYIRPNRPPPIPPFVNGPTPSKYHSRPTSYNPFKTSSYGSPYKSGNNFRSPAVKDHFRNPLPPSFPSLPSKPLPSPTFEYLPAASPPINNIINSDDNRGPIHEIPAPNLGPKPNQPDSKPIYGPPKNEIPDFQTHIFPTESTLLNFAKKPSYEVVESNDKIIEKPDGSKGYFAPDPDPSLPAPKIPPTHDPHSIPSNSQHSQNIPNIPTLNQNFPTGQEYQILEAGPNVHAPIPNLSSQELFDLMHSFPNDQYTVVQTSVLPQPQSMLTILGSSTPQQQQLEPQLQHQPQLELNQYLQQSSNSHQEVESHGQLHSSVVSHQGQQFQHQPQLQPNQYLQQPSSSHQEVQNNGQLHSSIVSHQGQQQYQDFNHPAYQSFNYEESNPNAAAVPMDNIDNNYHDQFRYEQDTSETENRPSVTVIRNTEEGNLGQQKKSESVKKTLPSDLSNLIPDDDFYKNFDKDQDQSPIFNMKEPEVPFYSSLPNKETAEALATLQAAGSVASKINQLRGDQNPNDESSQENIENGPFGLPKDEISKAQQINNSPNVGEQNGPSVEKSQNGPSLAGQMFVSDDEYDDEEPEPKKTDNVSVEVQKSVPLYEASLTAKSLTSGPESTDDEISVNLDIGQGAVSEKFGRKIRPK